MIEDQKFPYQILVYLDSILIALKLDHGGQKMADHTNFRCCLCVIDFQFECYFQDNWIPNSEEKESRYSKKLILIC